MRVFVYYNLHKKLWSVKALTGDFKGRVVAHLRELSIANATFKVSQAGRTRVLVEKRKNVHAGIVGELCAYERDFDAEVSYNPYKYEHFYDRATGSAVVKADVVSFNGKRVTYAGSLTN